MQGAVYRVAFAAALAWSPAAAAAAKSGLVEGGTGLRIERGERVAFKLTGGRRLEVVSSGAAKDADALPPKPGPGGPDRAAAEPGTIVAILGGSSGASVLKLDSGISQAFDYKAASLDAQGRETPLRTCTVLPLLPNFEAWTARADVVVIRGLAVRASNEVTCVGPEP